MAKISQMMESKFLRRDDVTEQGALVTISAVDQQDVAMGGAEPEFKWCLHFREPAFSKPMVLNVTNMNLAAKICGSDESDDWVGCRVVLYDDPSVQYKGKVTGGLRLRAPRGKAAKAAEKPAPAPVGMADEEDVPW